MRDEVVFRARNDTRTEFFQREEVRTDGASAKTASTRVGKRKLLCEVE